MRVAAVLFDMDGTVIDTEPVWLAAQQELTASYGVDWNEEDAAFTHGRSNHVGACYLAERGVRLEPEEIVRTLGSQVVRAMARDIPWLPGARELLERLRERKVPTALVTASEQFVAAPFVAVAGKYFDAVVTGDDVTDPKPAAQPYLLGAQRLGVDVGRCVALEDSASGIASALSAGCAVVGIERHLTIAPRPGLTRVGYLSEVTDEFLEQAVAGNAAWRAQVAADIAR